MTDVFHLGELVVGYFLGHNPKEVWDLATGPHGLPAQVHTDVSHRIREQEEWAWWAWLVQVVLLLDKMK